MTGSAGKLVTRIPESGDLDALAEGFNRAFSDYSVPTEVTPETLQELVHARGISWELSRIALEGEAVRGFWLTGSEVAEGKLEAYDIATGVDPDFRRHGVARELFASVRRALAEAEAVRCSLEVIADNSRALALYKGLGFEETRRLDCYRFDQALVGVASPRGVRVSRMKDPNWRLFEGLWDWSPSWPSGIGTLRRAGDDALILMAELDGRPAGYAAIVTSNRNLAQIAVAPALRRRGIGSALLSAVSSRVGMTEGLRALNVPEAAVPTRRLLEGAGAEVFVSQIEMVLEL